MKFFQHSRKFQMHWLGPYVTWFVTVENVVKLDKLNGEFVEGLVNGSQMKLYRDNCSSTH
jgi:hypothetical protein